MYATWRIYWSRLVIKVTDDSNVLYLKPFAGGVAVRPDCVETDGLSNFFSDQSASEQLKE